MKNQTDQSVRDRFFAPVHKALAEPDAGTRKCPSLSDRDHILSGIGRVMGTERSGCGWVQHMQMDWGAAVSVCGFFDSLKSARRLALVEDIATHVRLQADPRNTGVLSDEYVSTSVGHMMRRIGYRDPETGRGFSFMTSEFTVPPGLLAFIYKLRWDIEKAFDEKKNKLGVVKAWSSSAEAKCQQAHFVCLAHNLMLMLERLIGEAEGVRDGKVEAKRAKRQALAERIAAEAGRRPNPLVAGCARATERSLQFIRWLRYCLGKPRHWSLEIESLHPYMEAYIS